MKITLIGVGMGDPATLTGEAEDALLEAETIIGSGRILAMLPAEYPGERLALPLPEGAVAAVNANPHWKSVAIALSGDVGFHSGARILMDRLADHDPRLVCGISSPQYFAARLKRPWQNFRLVSAHSEKCNILGEVLNHKEVFFLTGGGASTLQIIDALCDAGLDDVTVTVGENLSAPDEQIRVSTARQLKGNAFSPLSVVLVENGDRFSCPASSPGIEDKAFVRGRTPMTKREVRAVILSLLKPKQEGNYFDIGAGTGSVSIETALIARRGMVYAIEREAEACQLIETNRQLFGTYNLKILRGSAPEALRDLPVPTAAFIGGSGGELREILDLLVQMNPRVRLVVSAVTFETLSAATEEMQKLGLRNVEVSQIAVSRILARGNANMFTALNPVFLISGGGVDGE